MIRIDPMIRPTSDEIIEQITLKPYEEVTHFIGVYENAIPQPIIGLIYQPHNPGVVLESLARIEGVGDYTLIYNLKNTSADAYTVTITSRWSDV
jgi:hypothetical protein